MTKNDQTCAHEVTFVELWDYWIHLFAAKKFRTQQPLWLELGPRRDRSEQVPLDLQTIRKWLLVGTLLMIVNLQLARREATVRYGQNMMNMSELANGSM